VAEAAKVIENAQRDLNIAFVNELSEIFSTLGIDTNDVLEAAGTKWNFLRFTPGLVGGHCIGVDPYYLTHRAIKAGYHPEVILAGRRVNDNVGRRVARECIRKLLRREQRATSALVFGLSFKEGIPDIRNSKAADIVREMLSFGLRVQVHDPLADPGEVRREYGFELTEFSKLAPADAVILAVPHAWYLEQGWSLVRRHLTDGSGVVCDVKGTLDRAQKPEGVDLIRL
jgi:UDP-N-acetyl-D-galactosamine dehydrogenase